MEPSPLTQVSRPETFQPKIVQLYEALFQPPDPPDDLDHEHSEGFWQEFFLLKPDPPSLRRVLQKLNPDEMLHLQVNRHSNQDFPDDAAQNEAYTFRVRKRSPRSNSSPAQLIVCRMPKPRPTRSRSM